MSTEYPVDVYFYEAFDEEAESLRRHLQARGLKIRAEFAPKTIQETGQRELPAPIISIRTQSFIPDDWLASLSGILTRTTGYDQMQLIAKRMNKPVPCGYLPLYCHRAVAEQAMLLWTALMRKLPQQTLQFAHFNRNGLTGLECEHKNLLCIGVGNVGHEVLKIGKGLGMETRGVDIVQRHADVAYVTPQEGLPWADVIVCAMNLTPDNIGYFDYRTLKRAKRGAFFINVARGELSPSPPLLRLLDEEHLAGVALDVYDKEGELAVALRSEQNVKDADLQATLEMALRPNVILTPHNAFNTQEAVERKAAQSIEQLAHFLRTKRFLWPVPAM